MIGIFGDETKPSGRTRVKICGITNAADADVAIGCGADALGFNFFRGSPRYIDISSAKVWMARLPREVLKVAVLVDPTAAEAMETAELPFIDALQLHGDESPGFCESLAKQGIAFAKAVGVCDENSIRDLPSFFTRTILLDSRSENFGGSGQTFPWDLARKVVNERPNVQVILAGGLSPKNVGEAISEVRPFAVDVTTGVEASAGRKDVSRIRAFIGAVRSADAGRRPRPISG